MATLASERLQVASLTVWITFHTVITEDRVSSSFLHRNNFLEIPISAQHAVVSIITSLALRRTSKAKRVHSRVVHVESCFTSSTIIILAGQAVLDGASHTSLVNVCKGSHRAESAVTNTDSSDIKDTFSVDQVVAIHALGADAIKAIFARRVTSLRTNVSLNSADIDCLQPVAINASERVEFGAGESASRAFLAGIGLHVGTIRATGAGSDVLGVA